MTTHEAQPDSAAPAPAPLRPGVTIPTIVSANGRGGALREFVLIVAGVLVALAGNSWWEGRRDGQREQAYLLQLRSDLVVMQSMLDSAIAGETRAQARARRMNQLLRSSGDVPPHDSILAWSGAQAASSFAPGTGTLTALLQSGDIRLIRNDSVRAAIIEYSGSMEARTTALATTREVFLERSSRSRQRLEPYKTYEQARWQDTTVTVRSFDIDAMRRDSDLRAVYSDLETSYRTARSILTALSRGTERLMHHLPVPQ